MCKQISIADSFFIRDESLCLFPLFCQPWGASSLNLCRPYSRWHTCVTVLWHLEGLVSLASFILSPSGSYNFSTSFYKVPWALHVCRGDGVGRLGTWWRQPMSDWVFKSCNIFDSIKCIIIVDFHEPWSCLMDKMIGTGRLWNTIAVIWWRTSN